VIARRKDRLDALAKRLTADCSINVEVLAADLADPDQLATVEQHVTEAAALDPLVNNAGFGAYMPFAKLLPDRAAH
jgi:short-subunit dehydrogenase